MPKLRICPQSIFNQSQLRAVVWFAGNEQPFLIYQSENYFEQSLYKINFLLQTQMISEWFHTILLAVGHWDFQMICKHPNRLGMKHHVRVYQRVNLAS